MAEVTACQLCGSDRDLSVVLDLGWQPLAERMEPDAPAYPLALAECGNCGLIQLTHQVDQAELFPPDHPYSSGNTAALCRHFAGLAACVSGCAAPGDLIVDIGANDGSLLREFSPSFRRVAVEPTNQVAKAGDGIVAYRDWFTAELAVTIRLEHGPARIITATNVLAHVPSPHDFMTGVAQLLAPGGLFITENHSAHALTEGNQWDAAYCEHIRYWTLPTLSRLLAAHGLEAIAAVPVATHGGSLRVIAREPSRTAGMQERADRSARELRDLLAGLAAQGKTVYGVSATTRAPALIRFAGIERYIPCVCEISGSEKIGKHMPGTNIPVVDEAVLEREQPDYALIFAYHIAEPLMANLSASGFKGKFIIPLPEPRVVDG